MDARRDWMLSTSCVIGKLFEWYDVYSYGGLAPINGRSFFPPDNPTVELLYSLAGFAIGFGFRPLGAALFGYLGDRLGRKYTFLATIVLMGAATAGVGLTPSAARSEEHTSELQSLMRSSYAVFCLKKKNNKHIRIQIYYLKKTK